MPGSRPVVGAITSEVNGLEESDYLYYAYFARAVDLFFFFQAEDGIRDLTVTGVQTCALPISQTGKTGCHDHRGRHHGRGGAEDAAGGLWPRRAEIPRRQGQNLRGNPHRRRRPDRKSVV